MKISLPALVGLVGLGLAGCAHKQQTASKSGVDSSAKSNGAVTTQKDDAAPVAQAPIDPELQKLLNRSVIQFDFNGSELSEESRARLDKIAQALKKHETATIQIAGNCDERGTEEYNMSLGQERAEAARRYLSKLGVQDGRIRTISYGEGMPTDPRQTEDAYSKNRRDEISVDKK